tara:strand:+ start:435 stop:668 length:234 start_codon:yes stop_codon:yes gene_type:complete
MKQELIMRTEKQRQDDLIWMIVEDYLAMAEDWPEIHPDNIEGAKDMIAEDLVIFERTEEYEKCARLKKAFEYLEQFK